MRITAAVTEREGAAFELQELELEEPRADEVLVRVVASGVCHTDMFIRDQHYPTPLPAVLGHEGAGVVEAVGDRVRKVEPGDHVAMSYLSCGRCPSCLRGLGPYCRDFFACNFAGARLDGTTTLSRDGEPVHGSFFSQSSFATHALASERNVVKVPKDVPLELLGPLGCGVQTGAGAVLNSLRPFAGSSIAIFGAGSVGLSAVMAAPLAGCTTVIAVDPVAGRRALARELGATHALDPADGDPVERIRELCGGADCSIEAVGAPHVLRQALDCLAAAGTCGLIGGTPPGTDVAIEMAHVLTGGRTLRGIVEGDSVPDLFIPALIELYRQGRFPFDRLVELYDFEAIEDAVRDSEQGSVVKPVLRMA